MNTVVQKYIKKIIKRKTLIISVIFIIWISFIDQNSIVNQIKYSLKIERLKKQKAKITEQIIQDSIYIQMLKDTASIERFAREKYYFHKANEEVFIIQKSKK